MVFNMDETSIRINNRNNKTIAPIGEEEIIINGDQDTKECFTAIGNCSKLEKFKLIVLGVGTTYRYCHKFGANAEAWSFLRG